MPSQLVSILREFADTAYYGKVLPTTSTDWVFRTDKLLGENWQKAKDLESVFELDNNDALWPTLRQAVTGMDAIATQLDELIQDGQSEEIDNLYAFVQDDGNQNDLQKIVAQYQVAIPKLEKLRETAQRLLDPKNKRSLPKIVEWCDALSRHDQVKTWGDCYWLFRNQYQETVKARYMFEIAHVKAHSAWNWSGRTIRDWQYQSDTSPGRTLKEHRAQHKGGRDWAKSGSLEFVKRNNRGTAVGYRPLSDKIVVEAAQWRDGGIHFQDEGAEYEYVLRHAKSEIYKDKYQSARPKCIDWIKMQALECALRGSEDTLGSYKREDMFSEQAEQFLTVQNHLQSTLSFAALMAENLRKIEAELTNLSRNIGELIDDFQDCFANLCADEVNEAIMAWGRSADNVELMKKSVHRVEHIQLKLPSVPTSKPGCKFLKNDGSPPVPANSELIFGLSYLDFWSHKNLWGFSRIVNGELHLESPADPVQLGASWLQVPHNPQPTGRNHIQTGTRLYHHQKIFPNSDWKPAGDRCWEAWVPFAKKYDETVTPKVECYLQGVEIDRAKGIRVSVEALNPNQEGFTLRMSTWEATDPWIIEMGWLAYVPYTGGPRIWTVRKPFEKAKDACTALPESAWFPDGYYDDVPQCIALISRLDMREGANWRLNSHVTDVTSMQVGFVGESWDDTLMWPCHVTLVSIGNPPRTWQIQEGYKER